jgi:hypothetical protein
MSLMRFCMSDLRLPPSAAINEVSSFHKLSLLQSPTVSVLDLLKAQMQYMTIHCANGQCITLLLDQSFTVFMSNTSIPPFLELKNCFIFHCFLICAFWMLH